MTFVYIFTFILILPLCSQQDISFPTSVQEDQSLNMELSLSAPQNMIQINVGDTKDKNIEYDSEDKVANVVLDLALQLQRRHNKRDGFWVYSPISVAGAIYMLLLGSYGKTYSELSAVLKVKVNPTSLIPHQEFSNVLRDVQKTKGDNVVNVANGIFVQQGFNVRQDYRMLAAMLYKTQVQLVDFSLQPAETQQQINSWVKKQTRDKIHQVLRGEPLFTTKMILVNTLYFKADWEKPFPSDLTKLHSFYPNGRSQPSTTKVQMMANQGTYKYYQDQVLNLEIVQLPYKGGEISMYLMLPQNSNNEKVSNLLQTLSGSDLNQLVDKTVPLNNMIVAMPRLNITTDVKLVDGLKDMGVNVLFNKYEADLSLLATGNIGQNKTLVVEDDRFIFTRSKKLNVTERRRRRQIDLEKRKFEVPLYNPGLYVDTMLHQVILEVNEKGTEAAAATTAMLSKTLTRTVKADAPYLLLVRHELTKAPLLFAGVTNPPNAG